MHHRVGAMLDEQRGAPRRDRESRPRTSGTPFGSDCRVTGRQIVEHGHGVAGLDEGADGVAADVAGAAGDDNSRHR